MIGVFGEFSHVIDTGYGSFSVVMVGPVVRVVEIPNIPAPEVGGVVPEVGGVGPEVGGVVVEVGGGGPEAEGGGPEVGGGAPELEELLEGD